ncbi:MAG: MarR family transcriptional regulator [Actinomycetota bacterium]
MSSQSPTPGRSTLEIDLIEALSGVAFAVMAALTKAAGERDFSLTQLRMLGILRDRRLTITELADALGLDRSSVSGLVERTERRGMVERAPNPHDARSVLVTLSSSGQSALLDGAAEIAAQLTGLTDALMSDEMARLTQLLDRMLEHRGLP